MHHQLSKSNAGSAVTGGATGNMLGQSTGASASGLQNAKHKVNLSADINMVSNTIGQAPLSNQNQNK